MLSNIAARRARIKAYDLSSLRTRFITRYPRYAHQFALCESELKRVFEIMLHAKKPVEVAGPINGLLGMFIARDAEYRAFCEAVYGQYLKRIGLPAGYEPGGEYTENFRRHYQELFTEEPPAIWQDEGVLEHA